MTDNRPKRPVESEIDKRTQKAATERMAVGPLLGHGLFYIHNADSSPDAKGEYSVDIINQACDCQDVQWNNPDNGCKHYQRVMMTIGIDEIPDTVEPDDLLLKQRGSHE